MSQIEIPDWVVEAAAEAISERHLSNTGLPFPIAACREDAKAALSAALGVMGIAELIETARTLSGSISFRIDDPRCELHCKLADALLRLRTKENADVS